MKYNEKKVLFKSSQDYLHTGIRTRINAVNGRHPTTGINSRHIEYTMDIRRYGVCGAFQVIPRPSPYRELNPDLLVENQLS